MTKLINEQLLKACEENDWDQIERLVEKGHADVNCIVGDLTPLIIACGDNNVELVEFLMDYDADITALSYQAVIEACSHQNTKILKYLMKQDDINDKVLKAIRDNDEEGKTYFKDLAKTIIQDELLTTCSNGNVSSMKTWIEKGADIHDFSLIRRSIAERMIDPIKVLVEEGIDIHREFYGDSLLSYATSKDFSEVVEYILEKGANAQSQNYKAIIEAAKSGYIKSFNILLKYIPDVSELEETLKKEIKLNAYYRDKENIKEMLRVLELKALGSKLDNNLMENNIKAKKIKI